MKKYKGAIVGFIVGVMYALFCAFIFSVGEKYSTSNLEFISLAMLAGTPLSVGVITVFFGTKEQLQSKYYRWFYPWLSIFGWVTLSVLIKWETLICIVMLLPLYLPLATLGGIIGGYVRNNYCEKTNKSVASCFAILPLLFMPIESHIKSPSLRESVSNSITINAPIDKVWGSLPNIEKIQSTELPWTFSHFIGIPKPMAAITPTFQVGGTREIYWEKGVHFIEVITEITKNQKLSYKVLVDQQSMEVAGLDTHIVVGDKYFNVESGYYSLLPVGNKTILTLTTSYIMNTRLNWYGHLWSNFVLSDFHNAVLHVIKNRNEKI